MRARGPGLTLVVMALLLAAVAAAADRVVVEDWSRNRVGTRGIPSDWKGQNWGSPAYDFAVVDNDSHHVLHMRSNNDSSTITRDIRSKVNLAETPLLEWRWKVTALPKGGNSCQKVADDQAAQIFLVWPRFPEAVRSRIIGYVWDSTVKAGTICPSEKTRTVTYVIIRSGDAELGKWLTEQRNVREDFKKIYGEEPENPAAIALAIDSNDTKSTAESFIGPLLFRSP
jgi:Protein of unknown function (DUF3047)